MELPIHKMSIKKNTAATIKNESRLRNILFLSFTGFM